MFTGPPRRTGLVAIASLAVATPGNHGQSMRSAARSSASLEPGLTPNAAPAPHAARLRRIQNELFDLGADLSVPFAADDGKLRITQEAVDRLERDCDEANAPLSELRSFVLPGGSEAAARLHVARAACRRAEREVLEAEGERPVDPLALVYLNRLSDLLFILARVANIGGVEPLWRPGGAR